MKELLLKDIYAGLPDAKDEYSYEGFDTIKKCFVSPPNFNIEDLIYGKKCFIRGYKGTGKTALLYYISNKLFEENPYSRISFILFKNFENSEKDKIQKIAENINTPKEINLTVPNDYDISIDGYRYIWKWILLEQLVRDNNDYNGKLFDNDENYKNFIKTLSIISFNRLHKEPFKFPNIIKLACTFNIPPYNTIITPEMTLDFGKIEKTPEVFEIFKNIIDDSMNRLSLCKRTDTPYYIMLDELEAFYQKEDIFKRDLLLLRDLIFTVKEFNLMFKKSQFGNTKLICCIRTEVVNAINKYISSYEINKVTDGFEYPLLWNYNTNNSINHPIFQILLKRIELTEKNNGNLDITNKEIFEKWFDPEIDNISIIEFFLNQTWNKPRDVVRFLLAVQSSLSASKTKFSRQVFIESMNEYSKKSLAEVKEELNASYTKNEIDEIFVWLNGNRVLFNQEELQARVNKHFPNSSLKNKIDSVIKSLYRVGVIGNYSKITKNYLWKHRGNEDPIFDDEWLFHIHRGLFKALNINKENNYRKFLYENKKPVKIGEVFECTITKIHPKSISVNFNDEYKIHKGSIYISEVIDQYITEEYLNEKFYIGETIYAILLEYNETIGIWSMSIKQCPPINYTSD